MSFADLGVSKHVVRALSRRGIDQPFPVQQMVIRDALAGHDLLVQSPTGSGKTLAFGVPLVDRVEAGAEHLSALVLAPTRELASQIVDELQSVTQARRLRIAAVYGGLGFRPQSPPPKRPDIVVATPGPLEDPISPGVISPDRVTTPVPHEAPPIPAIGSKPPPDRTRPRPLRGWRCRSTDRNRCRSPRDRRRRDHPGRQLRCARGPGLLRTPGGSHRPRRPSRHRDQLRARRSGRRGATYGRRPRPRPGVRPGTGRARTGQGSATRLEKPPAPSPQP